MIAKTQALCYADNVLLKTLPMKFGQKSRDAAAFGAGSAGERVVVRIETRAQRQKRK
jgi:hypothetical protein